MRPPYVGKKNFNCLGCICQMIRNNVFCYTKHFRIMYCEVKSMLVQGSDTTAFAPIQWLT